MENVPELISVLKRHTGGFAPVVPFDRKTDRLLLLDFTAANTELTPEILNDTERFVHYINRQLHQAGARYGIGGYNEHRTIYSRSEVFDAAGGEEPRRLHLGTDIWADAGTPVMAPLEARVHSCGFHPALGDYGAVIILEHQLEGERCYTLYGHLSKASIANLSAGDTIRQGQVFAWFGAPGENGWWPPHLHFQVMRDMQGWKGDYPGVCAYSQRNRWLSNCIDPDLILNMMPLAT